eukprot:8583104-Pyramimonas_sp.AAC.1
MRARGAGAYNLKFAKVYYGEVTKHLGADGAKLATMTAEAFFKVGSSHPPITPLSPPSQATAHISKK